MSGDMSDGNEGANKAAPEVEPEPRDLPGLDDLPTIADPTAPITAPTTAPTTVAAPPAVTPRNETVVASTPAPVAPASTTPAPAPTPVVSAPAPAAPTAAPPSAVSSPAVSSPAVSSPAVDSAASIPDVPVPTASSPSIPDTPASAPTPVPASIPDPESAASGPLPTADADDVVDRPRGPMPRIMAVANQKGGVGKTTSTVNIGACLAEQGFRTLIVDMDPQANATTGVGIDPRSLEQSLYDVIVHQRPIDDCIEPTAVKNLFLVPSGVELAGAEIELVPMMSREHRLRQAIASIIDDFDYVLIDCPPSLGLLTVNALTAAREVLVPIQCEYYALEGLGQLLRNVDLVKANLNPDLDVSTIVLVMYDARTKLAGQVVDEVRSHFGNRVCREVIPRTVRLSEAPSYGQPITAFDSGSRGAQAYRAVTKEISGVTS